MFVLLIFLFLAVWDYTGRRRAADVLAGGCFYGLHSAKPFYFALPRRLKFLRECNRK